MLCFSIFPMKHEDLPWIYRVILFRRSWGDFFGDPLGSPCCAQWMAVAQSEGKFMWHIGQHWGFIWTNIGVLPNAAPTFAQHHFLGKTSYD